MVSDFSAILWSAKEAIHKVGERHEFHRIIVGVFCGGPRKQRKRKRPGEAVENPEWAVGFPMKDMRFLEAAN